MMLTFGVGVVHELDGNFEGAALDFLEGGVKRSPLEVGVGHELGEGRRSLEEGLLGYRLHAGADRAKGNAREDVAVVTLARIQCLVAVLDGREGRAAREDGATLRHYRLRMRRSKGAREREREREQQQSTPRWRCRPPRRYTRPCSSDC
jgi:hypothetical protein